MVYFDTTNYYETNANYTLSANVSISLWLQAKNLSGGTKYRFFGSDNAFEARILNNKIEGDIFESGATPIISTTSIYVFEWTHIVFTRASNGDVYLYFNGYQDAFLASNNDTPGVAPLRIGASPASSERFDGYIEDFKIFSRVLTPIEVSVMFHCNGKDYIMDDLTHRWVLNEGTFNQEVPIINDRVGSLNLDYNKTSTYYPQSKEPKNKYLRW